jgi:hypothetical protein
MKQPFRRPRGDADRAAEGRSLFREVNERIRELGDRFDLTDGSVSIVCECGNGGCHGLIELGVAEYEQVRQSSTRFVVLPGHEAAGDELVVSRGGRFLVVERLRD